MDFIGPKIKFRINKEENYKSYLGASLSIISYCLYIIFFIIFGLDIIRKKKPMVLINQLTSDGTENYTIANDTFLAFRIDDFKGNEFDFSNLFSIKISWELYDNNNDTTIDSKFFSYQRCSDPKFLDLFAKDLIFDPNDYYCLDTSQIAGKNLFGTDDTDQLSYLLFQLDICDVKNNVNCKDYISSRDIIAKNKLHMNILYNHIIFTPTDFDTPFTPAIKKYRSGLHLNLNKRDVFYYMKNLLKQDSNILIPQEEELNEIYGVDNIERYVYFRTDQELNSIYGNNNSNTIGSLENNLHNIYFKYEPNYKVFTRIYLKIPDVLASLNGFMDLVMWIIGFVNIYTRTHLWYSYFNRCIKLKVSDFSNANSQIQRINMTKYIRMGEARVPIKGLDQNVNDPENINYFNQENLKNVENNSEKIHNEDKKIDIVEDYQDPESKIIKSENSEKHTNKIFYSKIEMIEEQEYENGNTNGKSNQPNIKVLFLKNSEEEKINDNNELEDKINQDSGNKSDLNISKNLDSRVSTLFEKRQNQLNLNFFDFYLRYFCLSCTHKKYKSKNNRKNYETVLLRHYQEKIENKVDIFHYLKAIGKITGLSDMLIKHEDEKFCFNKLTEYLYTVKVNDDYDCKNIKKDESSKKLRIHSYLSKPEHKVNAYIVDKFKEIVLK